MTQESFKDGAGGSSELSNFICMIQGGEKKANISSQFHEGKCIKDS